MKKDTIKKIIADGVVLVGYLMLIISLLMFLILNDGIFFSTIGLGVIFLIGLIVLPIGYIHLARLKVKPVDNRQHRTLAVGALLIAVITFVCCILFTSVVDLFQPLALSTTTNILLIVSCALLLLGALLELVFDNSRLSFIVTVMLVLTMFTGIIWANAEGYKDFNEDVIEERQTIFTNGEGGYATFRIPSIVALNHYDINRAKGYKLEHDILLATAEGRKDSSRDIGSIDMVGKISIDGGATWGELIKIYSYEDKVGKFGNPTPVLDAVTGNLIFPYMTAVKEGNKFSAYKTYVAIATINEDGTITFPKHEDNLDISFKDNEDVGGGSDNVTKSTLMVGPGKGIQLRYNTRNRGRLIIPASSGGDSFVMYSDDHGVTWNKGASAGLGNECEAVELESGELRMVVRENRGCSQDHFEQYQRISYSSDGGATWYRQTVDTNLKSPICMSSIDKLLNGNVVLTYPDSFYTRVNLSIAISTNNATSFESVSLYSGPAGYSCVTVDSANNIFVLAEIGKVNYNEELVLLKVDVNKLK